jgi:hypothetical protein
MHRSACFGVAVIAGLLGCDRTRSKAPPPPPPSPVAPAAEAPADHGDWDHVVQKHFGEEIEKGKEVFRNDTFGSEAFWGDKLKLHRAILGEQLGGVGAGLSARTALQLGLKVDVKQLPDGVVRAIKSGSADLDSPKTTLALLRANAVLGVRGVFDDRGRMVGIGITCAFCHSTVDNGLAAGIGRRLDGWPNRDLDVGRIVSLAPDLSPFERLLGASREQVTAVLQSWGPGKYDAELNLDGKAFRPDGKSAATVLPATFGLAGQNLHTYTGWGSIPYWNAFVANTQMMGLGTFVDRRIVAERFPLVRKTGFADKRDPDDRITSKLAALHLYQIALPPPRPDKGSFDAAAAARGERIFAGKARCATCHVPPLFSEPGWPMHTGAEIGIDDFQAGRSPNRMYRTTPLRGLFTRLKPGLYHDGRFPTLEAVIDHYAARFGFALTPAERADLVEYLKSI